MNAERERLDTQRKGTENWKLWGPYMADRAWGTVREDYSPDGTVWDYFSHDQARSRTYRWNEDGLGGVCDEKQRLCFALSLWNGCDPILKERAFGLTGKEGNHGEDVKEYYFYLDATPSHSYLHYLYKYPQREYPYALLVDENRRRTRQNPSFNLLDTGVFADDRYWDVHVVYAKSDPRGIWIRITAHNRGAEVATVHILPTVWFRNTWSWGDKARKPRLFAAEPSPGAAWSVWAEHPDLGIYHLHGSQPSQLLFTENESNSISQRLVNIFRRDSKGLRPVFPEESPFQTDPHWKDLFLFHEYFHGDTGQGMGASHQTGWTALAANLVKNAMN